MFIVDVVAGGRVRRGILDAALTPAVLPTGGRSPNDGSVMNTSILLGAVCLLLGLSALTGSVIRSMSHNWSWGVHELYLLPLVGLGLVLVGQELIQ